jgi:hypothetical protein
MTAALNWRDVLAAATPAMQNASKRAAAERMLRMHPDWSNRRIARSIHIIIITDDDLDEPVHGVEQRQSQTLGAKS